MTGGLLALLLSLPVQAAELTVQVESVGATVPQTTRSRLRQTLGRVLGFYEHTLGIRYPSEMTIRVTVYGDEAAFREVARARGLPDWSDGFFGASKDENGRMRPEAALYGDDLAEMHGVFLHEGAHWLLGVGGRAPRWMNEGLAQAFEHSRMSGNVLTVHPPDRFVEILARSDAPSVEGIVLNPSSWNDLPANQAGVLYIHGWALTAFLLSSDAGHDTLAAIHAAYREKGTKQSGLDAIDATYRGGVAGLQGDLERWVANPPSSVVIPRRRVQEQSSDSLWTTCPDGRLVSRSIGCD